MHGDALRGLAAPNDGRGRLVFELHARRLAHFAR